MVVWGQVIALNTLKGGWVGMGLHRLGAPLYTAAEAIMASNDFDAVSAVLAPDFVLEWPQTIERIRGAKRFARMNQEYPAHGPWIFTIHRLVGSETEAVSYVGIIDGVLKQPVPYEPPTGRAHWVEAME